MKWLKFVSLMAAMLLGSDCLTKDKCPASRLSADIAFTLIDVDFEDDSSSSILFDNSQGLVKWKIEDYDYSWESYRPPRPASGYKYIRVDRGASRSFGVAILSFPDLLLTSFETLTVSFSFWISSKWSKFNNLQLFVVENGQETLLKDLSEYSNNEINQEWNVVDGISHQPNKLSTSVTFVFYAFCGTNEEDAIAIDNILVTQLGSTTNSITTSTLATTDFTTRVSATIESTTTKVSTTKSATTEAPTTEPTTEAPTTEATTTESTTEYTTKRFTISITTKSTTTELTTESPTPKLTTESPTPELTTESPTPELTTESPTPELTTESPTPELTTESPTPELTTESPTPELTTESPTPELTTESPTPELTTESPTPELTTESPTPELTTEPTTPNVYYDMVSPRITHRNYHARTHY